MNKNFFITRFPNAAGLKRGPNMMRKLCIKCLEEKTHGFQFYEQDSTTFTQSIFVCDACLAQAKKS